LTFRGLYEIDKQVFLEISIPYFPKQKAAITDIKRKTDAKTDKLMKNKQNYIKRK
jgi:hypothetical protein